MKNFVAPLHGLRGLAVIYVLLSHMGNRGWFLLPLGHDAIGKVGVWVFFALSAFLLTGRLRAQLQETPRSIAVGRYALARVLRIYPLYAVVLALHVVVGDMDGLGALRHLALAQGDGELWAIATEFQYYAIVPLVALARRPAWGLVAALAVCFGYGLAHPEQVFSNGLSILPKAAPFLLGSLLAVMPLPKRHGDLIGALSLAGLLVGSVAYRSTYHAGTLDAVGPWLSLWLAVSVAGLMFALVQPGFMARVFAVKPLVWMGQVSFSVYLLHMFAIRAVALLSLPPSVSAWIALAVTLAVSAVTYRYIERPGMTLGRRRVGQPAVA